ncbi:PBP1A family penicillin-binding protein [Candidatus Saccharibacteria bacterium]|nr:PBP1A family penicillin-binding protein [Candidatus Saccharibacteria bacterium]
MAKSKRQKLRKRQQQPFYETLSLGLPTPRIDSAYDWKAASDFGAAAGADLQRFLRRLYRFFWNHRARAIYLAIIAAGILTATIAGLTVAASTYAFYATDLSSPAALMAKKQVGTTILDRNGQVLYEAYGAQHIIIDPLGTLPMNLRNATLAAEDPNFYSEPGFSWRGMARAALVDVTQHGEVQGGSTLTQQLIKNSLLSSDKSFTRKFKEIVLATNLEQRYSKNQILEMYLNETYYGEGANGIEAAAQTYFHTPASKLSLSQSALLAGLPLGPSRLDPNVDLTAATQRRDFVLDRMLTLGQITREQAASAKAEPIVFYAQNYDIKAPWFVFYVLDQLTKQYGDTAVKQGGLTVTTTLDLKDEQTAEGIVSAQISKLGSHNLTNGALVSMEPGSGDILAMVGSANYNAPGWGAYNVAAYGLRQPGSSFKPFAYLTAFAKGWNGATTILDAPMVLPNGDGTTYIPENYDLRFHGTVTVRTALDNSLNIPAVKTLQFAGIPGTLKTASAMGITTLGSPNQYGLSLVLGAGEVTPLDMATAYGTIANGGTKVPSRYALKVADRYGNNITKPAVAATPNAIDARYAYMMTNILSDNHARQPEFPFNSPLRLTNVTTGVEIPAAAKTGTTNDFRDNWTVGYTPGIVTAVWAGNSNNTPMQNVDGITGAAPIWHDYMESVVGSGAPQTFSVPAGVTVANVCTSGGGLANPWDTAVTAEVFPTDKVPTNHCNSSAPTASPSPSPSPSPATSLGNSIKQLLKDAANAASPSSTPNPSGRNTPPGN